MTTEKLTSALRKWVPLLAITFATAGCAQLEEMTHKQKEPPAPPSQSPPVKGEFAPFQVKFKADGTPEVFSPEGRPLRGVRVRFPRKATQIRNLYSFTAVEAFGSHYIVMEVGPGYYICFDLPHEDGTYGTSCESPSPPAQ
jgi:hypothetical protein